MARELTQARKADPRENKSGRGRTVGDRIKQCLPANVDLPRDFDIQRDDARSHRDDEADCTSDTERDRGPLEIAIDRINCISRAVNATSNRLEDEMNRITGFRTELGAKSAADSEKDTPLPSGLLRQLALAIESLERAVVSLDVRAQRAEHI